MLFNLAITLLGMYPKEVIKDAVKRFMFNITVIYDAIHNNKNLA